MTRLPDDLRSSLEAEVGTGVVDVVPVGGGCIHHGARLTTATGAELFLKWNARAPAGMFAAEARGLESLRATGGLRVPEVVAVAPGEAPVGWLLLEYVGRGAPARDHDERLGRGLAGVHTSASPEEGWGWPEDNWIGALPQANEPAPGWAVFWRERRILPQLDAARRAGHLSGQQGRVLDRAVEAVEVALGEGLPGPHVVHGDLWSGNTYPDGDGLPVVIDPAVYRGHGEVDLAMSELFGGFGRRFYEAYREVVPVDEGYEAHRRALYQLYYLLVHVNLFGAGYVTGTLAAAAVVAALR